MSSVYNPNYIQTTYKDSGKTDYPTKFVEYLFKQKLMVPTGARVLDLGCGTGDFTLAIENAGYEAYGVDIGTAAREKLRLGRFEQADLTKRLSTPLNSMDVVFSKSVVEHLRNPEVLLNEAFGVLKPGGLVITMTPSWKHSYKEAFFIDHTHVTPFIKHSLSVLHELSGFEQISTEYFYQLPKLWDKRTSWYMKPVTKLIQLLELPYRPFSDAPWSEESNKLVRFSQEAMLLCIARKPKQTDG